MTPQNSTAKKVPIIFTRTVAAQLARVSLDFLDRLEAEELVQPLELEGGIGAIPPTTSGASAGSAASTTPWGWTWRPWK